MGKMKELFMKIHYPEIDYEREYLINDLLAQEREYLEYEELKKSSEFNILKTKIEVNNERKGRIEVEGEEIKVNEIRL